MINTQCGRLVMYGRLIAGSALFLLLGCDMSTPPRVPATPAVPPHLVFDEQPPTSTSAAADFGTVRVWALNADNQVATAYTSSVTLSLISSDTAAHLAGTATVNTVAGVATFTGLSVARAGTGYRLVAKASNADSAVSQTFEVLVGPASMLRFGSISGGPAGSPITATVRVTDAGGNTVVSETPTITVALARTGNWGVTIAPDDSLGPMTQTAVAGVATFPGRTFHKTGYYKFTASASGLTSATSTATIANAAITRVVFVTQPSTGTVGAALPAFVAQLMDDYGNGVSMPMGGPGGITISLGANPNGAVLSGTLTAGSFAVSPATFDNVKVDKPGSGYTLVATHQPFPSVPARTGTSAAFTVQQ